MDNQMPNPQNLSQDRTSMNIAAPGQGMIKNDRPEGQRCFHANLLNQISDAIITMDNEQHVTYMNQPAEQLYGVVSQDILGKPLDELVTWRWLKQSDEYEFQTELAEHGRWQGENIHITRSGREMIVESDVLVLSDPASGKTGLMTVIHDVNGRKKVEDTLQHRKYMLKKTQEIAHLGTWVFDLPRKQLYWSDEVYRIFGLEPQAFGATYEAFLDAVHSDDRKAVDTAYSESIREGKDAYEIEHRVVRKSTGEIRHVHEKCEHIRDASGNVIRSVGMVHDITERKQAEEKTAYLASFPNHNPNPVMEITLAGTVNYANPATARILKELGLDESDPSPFIPKDFKEIVSNVQGKDNVGLERELLIKDRVFLAGIDIRPQFGVARIYCRDITQRKQLESGLRHANEELEERVRKRTQEALNERQRLYNVLETLPVYVILLEKDYHVPFTNKYFRERFGESKGRRCYEYLFNKTAPCGNCETFKPLVTHAPHRWAWVGPDGRHYDVYDFPFAETDGSMSILEMGIDITERMQAEAALQAERQRLFAVLETLPAMICLLTSDYHVIFANRAFRERFGESNGRHCYEYCFGRSEPCDFCETHRVFETGDSHQWEILIRNGAQILEAHDFPFEDLDGSALILKMYIDITERRRTEARVLSVQIELERSRRLSDVGMLAATVAHELRNPLATIGMAAYNIRKKAEAPQLDKHLNTIEKKVAESDMIINNLLFYSRIKPPHYENTVLADILEECIEGLASEKRKNLTVVKQMDAIRGLALDADPLQIKEVFNNLLANALDAVLPGSGTIKLIAECQEESVTITIQDNGKGIDPHDMEKIFTPFFTRKSKGTGLGLTVCRQILDLHHGSIAIESQIGQGTAVTVCLPRTKPRAADDQKTNIDY